MSPTPEQVTAVADIIEQLNLSMEMHPNSHWRPSELRAEAERIAEDAREAAERRSMTHALALDLEALSVDIDMPRDERWAACARQLIESGWRKDGAA